MRDKLYRIIFFADTKAGRIFDLVLLYLVLISFIVVVLDSVQTTNEKLSATYYIIEWIFTIIFSIEYILRVFCHPKPFKYIFSVWGIVDIVSILPTFIGVFTGKGSHALQAVRVFRLIRAFRILRLTRFSNEAELLLNAIVNSAYKIIVFMVFMFCVVIILGTIMYVVESENPGFSSIPQSIYWAIVTVTTVGFGDVVPITILGKMIASITMMLGYVIIAVPTGITAVEYQRSSSNKKTQKTCSHCSSQNNSEANFCSNCGNQFE